MATRRITAQQIEDLSRTADMHGDSAMVEICALALAGDQTAVANCSKAINDAQAQNIRGRATPRRKLPPIQMKGTGHDDE